MNPHRASLSRHPLAEIAIAFAAGICAANYFPIRFVLLWIAGAVCAALVIVALVKGKLPVAGVALLLAVGVAGMTLAVQEQKNLQPLTLEELRQAGPLRGQ